MSSAELVPGLTEPGQLIVQACALPGDLAHACTELISRAQDRFANSQVDRMPLLLRDDDALPCP
jgi:hypothetical protein